MIVLQFDRGYLKWAKLLLTSLAKNSPGETVYINSVNLYNFQIKKLKELYSPVIIDNHKIKMKKKEKGNIMISRKPYVLRDVIKRFKEEKYLMLDVDIIVRKPLKYLFRKLDDNDGAFCFRTGIWDGKIYDQLRISTSTILLTSCSKPIVDKWIHVMENENEISGIKKGNWYWDQITLWKTLKEMKDLNLTTIEYSYYEGDPSNKDAAIWSSHMSDKKSAYKLFEQEING